MTSREMVEGWAARLRATPVWSGRRLPSASRDRRPRLCPGRTGCRPGGRRKRQPGGEPSKRRSRPGRTDYSFRHRRCLPPRRFQNSFTSLLLQSLHSLYGLWHSFRVFETKTNLATADAYLGVVSSVTLPGSTHAFGSAVENPIISVDLFSLRPNIRGGVSRFTTLHSANGARQWARRQAKTRKRPVYQGWLGSSVGRAED